MEPTLPAPSVHDPVTFASPLSGPLYVPEVQELIPDGPPSPENDTSTGLVYQPFESGRAGEGRFDRRRARVLLRR